MIVRVALPTPLRRFFDYLPNPGTTDYAPGCRVRVPFGRGRKVGVIVSCVEQSDVPPESLKPIEALLDEVPVLGVEQLRLLQWAADYYHHSLGDVIASALPSLLRSGGEARPRRDRYYQITAAGLEAVAARAPRQQQLLDHLRANPDGVIGAELRQLFPSAGAVMKQLEAKGWVAGRMAAPPVRGGVASPAHALNPAQQAAVGEIESRLDGFSAWLLDGVTGSGKTEVYFQLMAQVLANGRQVLILVPEIGLTPQLINRVAARFAVPLALLHSGLNDSERLNGWLDARAGRAPIVVGTRSAVFAPMPDLGLIIVDEEHDPSLKQQEGFRYSARDVAVIRAQQNSIPIVLGSATPSLESLDNVAQGRYRHLLLPERAGGAAQAAVRLLDMRGQTTHGCISGQLQEEMRAVLERGEQVLLFLNRRGYSPTLICHQCGWVAECRRCDARMTFHLGSNRLRCHHCGSERRRDSECGSCGSDDLRNLGYGTERLETVLSSLFPDVPIVRIDRDSVRNKGALEAHLDRVHESEACVLVGTQMLAKGHHFERVTLVGVLDADRGLFSNDFRATERMAQLLVQVSGRAGRAQLPGQVVLQSYQPEHPQLRLLLQQGYPAFAAEALAERHAAGLPPAAAWALLRAESTDQRAAIAFLEQALAAAGSPGSVELWGPIPAPMERLAGRYRHQLLVRAPKRAPLQRFLRVWVPELEALKVSRKVRWSLDVDPIETL